MSGHPRYAIYYVPAPESDLYRLGAQMLGYDSYRGDNLPLPDDLIAAAPDCKALTADPRKYGFHATLKAPMALADGRTEAELLSACAAFAAAARPIPVIWPDIHAIDLGAGGQFIALVPGGPSPELSRFAQDCVEAFDAFRAPLTAQDRARRKPAKLTAPQVAHLDRWGYPYVGDEFRFHMTLTGAVPAERAADLIAALKTHFAQLRRSPLAIDRIALCRQDEAGSRFRVIGHHGLSGQS